MRLSFCAALATVLLVCSPRAHADNLVYNYDFSDRFSGWSAVYARNGSSLFAIPYAAGFAAGGFFTGPSDTSSGYDLLYQALPTVAGRTYRVDFDLFYTDTNGQDFQVLWDGNVVFDPHTPETGYTGVKEHYDFLQTAFGNDTLGFRGFNGGGTTFLSDTSVSTYAIPPANTGVGPEPSSLLLLGTGIAATVGILRRRQAA